MKTLVRALVLAITLPALADRGFTQDITWRKADTPDPVAQAIYLMRTGDASQASRLLIVTPQQRRIVLTNRLTAGGVMEMMLRDEHSGWSASFTQNYGARKATLQELFRALDPENFKGSPLQVAFSFATTGAGAFTAELPMVAGPQDTFANQMMESETAEKTRASIPAEVKRELPFLIEALTDDVRGASFRWLVEILRAIVDDDDAYPRLKADLGGRVRGWQLTASDQVSFAAEFPSISIGDPLADR
jgi:hypothetical protein